MPPNPLDAVMPWIVFGVVIALLLRVQKAIQYRIFGLGWMFSAQHETAAVIYTLVLLPGIIVHEAAEWVVAGVLGYPTKTSMRWPEADNNGELDPKFVTVDYGKLPKTANTAQKLKDLFRKSAVEIAPTVVGIGLTLLISMSILRAVHGQQFDDAAPFCPTRDRHPRGGGGGVHAAAGSNRLL
jgi:hypothetical protein